MYYKIGQVLKQSGGSFYLFTKYEKCYYKVGQKVLQSSAGIIK